MNQLGYFALLFILCLHLDGSQGHGRLLEPIARTSAWRIDDRFEKNFNDAAMYCGGAFIQYEQNKGKCGICGEDWAEPRQYEKGGRYYKGHIMKTYTKGQFIVAVVEILANHLGWFEFRICNLDRLPKHRDATTECFEKNILKVSKHSKRAIVNKNDYGPMNYTVQLPPNLTCNHCVFQWKYHAGNSWGTDPRTKQQCVGCGNQEEFYGCSDIQIIDTLKRN